MNNSFNKLIKYKNKSNPKTTIIKHFPFRIKKDRDKDTNTNNNNLLLLISKVKITHFKNK